MTSRAEISQWFDDGVAKGATHMIVACDCYGWEDYPSYVMPGQDPKEKEKDILDHGMQKIMEVYNLSMDKEQQLRQTRAFNY
jgi:hypothetical protein